VPHWKTFIQKDGEIFFWSKFYFKILLWEQNNVFYDSMRPQTIFRLSSHRWNCRPKFMLHRSHHFTLTNFQIKIGAICIMENLTKNLSNQYICWTKSEQNPRYKRPKLTLPRQKNTNIVPQVFTLKVRTRKVDGNKGFHVLFFSYLRYWLLNKKCENIIG
jgi:hypothetical protein